MPKTNACETNLLKLIFQNTNWANIGDATGVRGSSAAGNFYISLHTADPGETGDQTTSEAAYGAYARVAVDRSTGFTVSGNSASNVAAIDFPTAISGTETITHFGVGRASTLAGELLYYGALSNPSSLPVATGITPSFAIGALIIQEE